MGVYFGWAFISGGCLFRVGVYFGKYGIFCFFKMAIFSCNEAAQSLHWFFIGQFQHFGVTLWSNFKQKGGGGGFFSFSDACRFIFSFTEEGVGNFRVINPTRWGQRFLSFPAPTYRPRKFATMTAWLSAHVWSFQFSSFFLLFRPKMTRRRSSFLLPNVRPHFELQSNS